MVSVIYGSFVVWYMGAKPFWDRNALAYVSSNYVHEYVTNQSPGGALMVVKTCKCGNVYVTSEDPELADKCNKCEKGEKE